ncbi:hypothetical protein U1Q18_034824 [Sarracenia purpurea var. burkii]
MQVKLFKETVQQNLPSLGEHNNRAKHALSESIFVVCMGSNDYINYLQPGSNARKLYNEEQFGEFLVKELGNHLEASFNFRELLNTFSPHNCFASPQDLYRVGARKFVVFEISPLGCLPDLIDKTKPPTSCNEQINGLVSIFNSYLGAKTNELTSTLNGSTFITAKTYQLVYDIVHNPLHHGFKDARYPCCASGINGNRGCKPGTVPCQRRDSHVFWDAVHPTEAVYRRIAAECFNGQALCTPMNIVQLSGQHL